MLHPGVDRLRHTNVVVHDLEATARCYTRLLGIGKWEVHHWTPDRLSHTQAFGYQTEFGYSTATGANAAGLTFRLIQPTHGFSTFTEFLISRGIGVHSFCAGVVGGLAVAQAVTFADGASSQMADAREALGGYYLEIADPTSVPPDDIWDFSTGAELPAEVAWLGRIPKILHFGIAVRSVMERLPQYASILGVERWSGVHFRFAPGSLVRSVLDGRDVQNAWFLAITDVANFGLELLQTTRGPTDYSRTIDRIGESIHHLLVRRDLSHPEWTALQEWMDSMHVGIVMSGQVRSGAAEFHYLDTRDALGFLMEVIVVRDVPPQGPAMQRYDLDFSRHA